jgi:hypothetical protein
VSECASARLGALALPTLGKGCPLRLDLSGERRPSTSRARGLVLNASFGDPAPERALLSVSVVPPESEDSMATEIHG